MLRVRVRVKVWLDLGFGFGLGVIALCGFNGVEDPKTDPRKGNQTKVTIPAVDAISSHM